MSLLNQSLTFARQDLRSCYYQNGILAGRHHFTDYWARDGYFAAFGSLSIGDTEIVENMVSMFFMFQRQDGLIPYRIMRGPISINKYLGRPSFYNSPKPTYKLRGFGNEVLDGTTLTLLFSVLTDNYKKHQSKIILALEYLCTREKKGLLWDGLMAEWNDTALKYGLLLYTNIIYWYMYDKLSSSNKQHKLKANSIAKAIRSQLWNGKYFADWYDYKRQDYFYPFGNCLAIAWGFTTSQESKLILNKCEQVKHNFSLETNYPKYPIWRIDPFQRLACMGNYQNQSTLWWQPVTAYIAALKKLHLYAKANKQIKLVLSRINTDKTIYECYDRSGNPLKRWNYSAENPFAWSAGMIIWALTAFTSDKQDKNKFPSLLK